MNIIHIYTATHIYTLINTHRIHGAAIYGNMDPINIPPMLAYMTQHQGSYGLGHMNRNKGLPSEKRSPACISVGSRSPLGSSLDGAADACVGRWARGPENTAGPF
jgi:hypothetical protein